MKNILILVQIIISIVFIFLILIQNSKGGLGTAFGGGGEFRSRRGAEQIVFRATIVFGVLFLIIAITNLLV
jgi:protein translocase SecG subunit